MPIPSGTFIHHVHLRVGNLDRAASFYQSTIGLTEISRSGAQALLSANGGLPAQLILSEMTDVRPRDPLSPGLFHVAWRVTDRHSLAKMIQHFRDRRTRLQGFADHGVSEALYLSDPEGNGIEIYRDRPREEWPTRDGKIEMMTEPLDIRGILEELKNETATGAPLDKGTTIGHIHLQVSDLGSARRFYHENLGFDVAQDSFPGALFVSAGGYHHHIGLNTWNSQGSGPSRNDTPGLASFGVALPDQESLSTLLKRLTRESNKPASSGEDSYIVSDSDNLQIELLHQPAIVSAPTMSR